MFELSSKSLIAITAGIIALSSVGWDALTTSNAEIQTYIETALKNGCQPVIDVCKNNCKETSIRGEVLDVCTPSKILRADPYKVQDVYLQMGRDLKENNVSKIPDAIRADLIRRKEVVQPLKEDLAIKANINSTIK